MAVVAHSRQSGMNDPTGSPGRRIRQDIPDAPCEGAAARDDAGAMQLPASAPPELHDLADLHRERREWSWQRAGAVLLSLFVLGGAFGLFGDGLLSDRSVASPDGRLRVVFERFLRCHNGAELILEVDPAGRADEFSVDLNRSYGEAMEIHGITPRPVREEPGPEGPRFWFRPAALPSTAVPPSGGAPAPLRIVIHFEPNRAGPAQCRLSYGPSSIEFRQFVYP